MGKKNPTQPKHHKHQPSCTELHTEKKEPCWISEVVIKPQVQHILLLYSFQILLFFSFHIIGNTKNPRNTQTGPSTAHAFPTSFDRCEWELPEVNNQTAPFQVQHRIKLLFSQSAASCVSELALHTAQRQPASSTGYYLITNNLSMLYSKWNQTRYLKHCCLCDCRKCQLLVHKSKPRRIKVN